MCAGHVAWVETDWVNLTTDGTVYTGDDLDDMDETDPEKFEALESREERRWIPVYGCDDPDAIMLARTCRSSTAAPRKARMTTEPTPPSRLRQRA